MNLNKHLSPKDIHAIGAYMYKKYTKNAPIGKCGKKALTETGAIILLAKIKYKREAMTGGVFRTETRYYFCKKCQAYHLTSETIKKKEK